MTDNNITYPIYDVKPKDVQIGQTIEVETVRRLERGFTTWHDSGIVTFKTRGSEPGGIAVTLKGEDDAIPLQTNAERSAIFITILGDPIRHIREAEYGQRFTDRYGDFWQRTHAGICAVDASGYVGEGRSWGYGGSTILEAHEQYGPFVAVEPEPEKPKREPGYYFGKVPYGPRRTYYWDGAQVRYVEDCTIPLTMEGGDLDERLHTYDPEEHILVKRSLGLGALDLNGRSFTPSLWADHLREGRALEAGDLHFLADRLDGLAEALK